MPVQCLNNANFNFQHDSVLANAHSTLSAPKPQYIFQVASSCKSTAETKWKELSKNHHIFYAYHGNRLENFYTILNFGLQQHLNKVINFSGHVPNKILSTFQ